MSFQIIPQKRNLGGIVGGALSEQLPKEIERQRLAYGLQNLGQEKDLSPFERYSRLLSLPGITPQGIQSGAELLKMEGRRRGLGKRTQDSGVGPPIPTQRQEVSPIENAPFTQQNVPTTPQVGPSEKHTGKGVPGAREALQSTYENYIPASQEQLFSRADQLLNAYPEYYQDDAELAFQDALREEGSKKAQSEALQERRKHQSDIEKGSRARLALQREKRNVKIPEDVYQKIENKMLNSTLPTDQGGEGLTEVESEKKYGNELDRISRQYQQIENIGNEGIIFEDKDKVVDTIDRLAKEFYERGDSRNLADQLISNVELSPLVAYSSAFPLELTNPELNEYINTIPDLKSSHYPTYGDPFPKVVPLPEGKAEEILGLLNNSSSVLSIANELKNKNYDVQAFLDYMQGQKSKLTDQQKDELTQVIPSRPYLNDLFLELSRKKKSKEPIKVRVKGPGQD